MNETVLGIKVDADTDRGTRIGVAGLLDLFAELGISATFLFSLGPDNTGRALRRIFRPGFLAKVLRTNVAGNYGLATLFNGVLWPGPHIGQRNEALMRAVRDAGHEVGIHCYDHIRWQDGLQTMRPEEVGREFAKARAEFQRIFATPARTAGAAGWQANAHSLEVYDAAELDYGSDTRGRGPFFPVVAGRRMKTLQLPTTLPTLDELLGRDAFPESALIPHYLDLLSTGGPHVMTVHAELEGMAHVEFFRALLAAARDKGIRFLKLAEIAASLGADGGSIPVCALEEGQVDGRGGKLAVQGPTVSAN